MRSPGPAFYDRLNAVLEASGFDRFVEDLRARFYGAVMGRRAVDNNRARLLSGVAKIAFKLRAELCERAFAHILDRGGMRRTWLRGRDNFAKRYLIDVAGFNLALLMRALTGCGTPKAAGEAPNLALLYLHAADAVVLTFIAVDGKHRPTAAHTIVIMPDASPLSTGC